jgi:hypothetical protein
MLLKEAEPAGVVLLHPWPSEPAVKECLSAGASVLVLGAPGRSSACKRLGLFAKLSGRSILAAPPFRFAPSLLLAKRLLDSGKVGAPISMTLRSTYRGAPRQGPDDDGPIPADQVYEAADLVYHLLGPLRQVAPRPMTTESSPPSEHRSPPRWFLVFHASGPAETVGIEVEVRADGTSRISTATDDSSANGSRTDAPSLDTRFRDPAVELGYEGLASQSRLVTSGRNGAGLVGPVGNVAPSANQYSCAAKGRPISVRAGGEGPPSPAVAQGPSVPATA